MNNDSLLVNVGCGPIHHPDWVNLDILESEGVRYHDVRDPLPFEDGSVNVIYHSHMLEHLTRDKGIEFIQECYRVLKPGGIIRIAVPDLEKICSEYLRNLERAYVSRSEEDVQNYHWNLLELFDQMTRTESGGEIQKAIFAGRVNQRYVLERTGDESANLFKARTPERSGFFRTMKRHIKRLFSYRYNPQKNGEAHKHMYDRLSLALLLEDAGFGGFEVCSFNTSRIPEWNTYGLDAASAGSGPRKPDSLFVEAIR